MNSDVTNTRPHHAHPHLEDARNRIVHRALLIREAEERLLCLYTEGKVFGTVHTCIGQEFSGAVLAEFLHPGDAVISNHRCHGHFLSITEDITGLIAETMGRQNGVCGGRGGSQHLCKNGFYSNGIQGGIVPVSAGLALARKLRGGDDLALVFIGDGTLGEGVVYETLNLAAKWELPLLIVLENNRYAQSTFSDETLAGNIRARAAAFGIETEAADTWQWEALYETAAQTTEYVRRTGKPAFLQIDTYRLKGHSKGDDNRSRAEVESYERRDPLNRMIAEAAPPIQEGLAWARRLVDQAAATAEVAEHAAPVPSVAASLPLLWLPAPPLPRCRHVEALNQAFKTVMAEDEQVLFIGEDVKAPYGGAFKVSKELSDLFPKRVRNTPISEAAITGLGCGLAMEGYKPFIEIMFGDFSTLAFDHLLNHAAKFRFMYNDQVSVPLVVRTPMGGHRGYGPTHSQTLDRHYLGIPGLRVLALHPFAAPEPILRNLLNERDPTLLIENKLMYGTFLGKDAPLGFQLFLSQEAYPTAWLRPEADHVDVTLIGYGGLAEILVRVADLIFEEHDLVAQVLCPAQLYPFDIRPWLPVLERGTAIVTVEEGQGFAGFAAELTAQLCQWRPDLAQLLRRVAPPPHPIPASAVLESQILPTEQHILAAIREVCHEA